MVAGRRITVHPGVVMKKLKLDLDALEVDSFDPAPVEAGEGTVHAEQLTLPGCKLPSLVHTCLSCPTNCVTCRHTCFTCHATCNYLSCLGTCYGRTCQYTCGQNTCARTCFRFNC
jgi:hypothetical protein